MGKRKDNRGRRRKGIWVLGIISEEERGRVVIEVIQTRGTDSIIPVIQKRVAPGTTIKTDKLNVYECLKNLQERYKHFAVNHSVHLVEPFTGLNTNLIEGTWAHFKASLPQFGLHSEDGCYESYLYQFAYQHLVRDRYPNDDSLLVFLRLWGEVVKNK